MAEKEYIEREAGIETIKNLYPSMPLVKLNVDKWHEKNKAYMECEIAIEAIPAADVRPVVLCRDCKYYFKDADGYEMCENSEGYDHVSEDGFCAWAARREES